jgi:hypothetical protein
LKVRFIYQGSTWLPNQEKVATKLCECVAQVIALPNEIEIEFANLAPHVYGETLLSGRFKNRFRISTALSPKEIIKPIVHELIHIHQVHVGKLSVMRDGTHIWMGRQYRNVDPNLLENAAYNNLPWEQDVHNQLEILLKLAITKT